MNRLTRSFLYSVLLSSSLAYATSCELILNQYTSVKAYLGSISIASSTSNSIWLSAVNGDKTAEFNRDDLFEFSNLYGSRYFRLNGEAYNHNGNYQTFLYEGAWAFGSIAPAGTYTVTAHNSTIKPVFGRTIDTVGDSITWWTYGRFLRCLMRDDGLKYDFSGSHTDIFGFKHDGEGGNKTVDVLDRMSNIPVSDAYFVLVGTNDRIDPVYTFENIVTISDQLKSKNSCAKIYISTLLPRNDEYNTRNQYVNELLREKTDWCAGCTLIDLGGYFYEKPNWTSYLMADNLHPNYAGYELISAYLASNIN